MSFLRKIISKIINLFLSATAQGMSKGELGSPEVSDEIKETARLAAAEGIVMLKNDGVLPLKDGTVAVFGRVQRDFFFVGYGSGGDVNKPYSVNLIDGMKNAGIAVDEQLAQTYARWTKLHPADDGVWGMWPRYYDEMKISEQTVSDAASRCESAVVVIGRSAGEDRENALSRGSYYLTRAERALLDKVTAKFNKVAVLINSGNIIDMSWLEDYGDRIGAVLYVWQGGMESGNAIGDVLSGKLSPSGKLSDTVAKEHKFYPAASNFGARHHNNYVEDIFVGYRYFETFAPEKVMFPFGFGMSYTEFELCDKAVIVDGDSISVCVTVKNVGEFSGKEVVQVYHGAPQGKLGKAAKSLVAYAKTRTLAPGEEQRMELSFSACRMASYDDSGKTGNVFCYVLEEGSYPIYVGTDSHSCVKSGEYTVPTLRVVERLSSHADCAPKYPFERMTAFEQPDGTVGLRYETVPTRTVSRREEIVGNLPKAPDFTGDRGIKLIDVVNGKATFEDFAAQLEDKELEALCRGDYVMNSKLGAPGNAAVYGGIKESLRDKGIPPVTATDGPSGIRLHCYASLLPIGTLLACTWNPELVESLYACLGEEMVKKGSDVLLAPGMNIHRDPLCGRNFEYFSEDPLLTGTMGAAFVRGMQSKGVSACPKHFACNNQETLRIFTDSRLSERALREIYLKGFEICVKTAKPHNIMTSYNKINGAWGHYHYGTCTGILRDEWGYDGCVMTDWWMRAAKDPDFKRLRNNGYRVRAQVDVLMPGAGAGSRAAVYDPTLLSSLGKDDGITRGEIVRSAINTLRFVTRSQPFTKEHSLGVTYVPGENWFEHR